MEESVILRNDIDANKRKFLLYDGISAKTYTVTEKNGHFYSVKDEETQEELANIHIQSYLSNLPPL